MSRARALDDLARHLAEPMPRRRAVRLIGASLIAVAAPGVSPRVARATLISAAAKCPDGSTCNPGGVCCPNKDPISGRYVCRARNETCCCGNTACDTAKLRCYCPSPGQGVCAPKCALENGPGWKDCGADCCAPYMTCGKDNECHACEDEGKHTCSSYDNKSSHRCCNPGRCCADMTSTECCGPKQTCKPAGRNRVRCKCRVGTDVKCGTDCCDKNSSEFCCGGKTCCDRNKGETCCGGVCCEAGDTCCDGECCDALTEYCYVVGNVRGCVKRDKCKPPDTPQCGSYCCGPNMRCTRRKGKAVCV
jgi:hypothetical protein